MTDFGFRIGRDRSIFPAAIRDMRIIHAPNEPYGRGLLARHVLLIDGSVWGFRSLAFGWYVVWKSSEPAWRPFGDRR